MRDAYRSGDVARKVSMQHTAGITVGNNVHGCGVRLSLGYLLTARHVAEHVQSCHEIVLHLPHCGSATCSLRQCYMAKHHDVALLRVSPIGGEKELQPLPIISGLGADLWGDFYSTTYFNATFCQVKLSYGCYDAKEGMHFLHGPGRTGHSGAGVYDLKGRLLGLHITGLDPRLGRTTKRADDATDLADSIRHMVWNASAVGCGIVPLAHVRCWSWEKTMQVMPSRFEMEFLGRKAAEAVVVKAKVFL
jgi:hypothetical protein